VTDAAGSSSPITEPDVDPTVAERLAAAAERALAGNVAKVGDKLEKQGTLFVRDRLDLLLDPGSFVVEALLANA
jgi:acetyl-CoA carboxylase carboxyltransferase component